MYSILAINPYIGSGESVSIDYECITYIFNFGYKLTFGYSQYKFAAILVLDIGTRHAKCHYVSYLAIRNIILKKQIKFLISVHFSQVSDFFVQQKNYERLSFVNNIN